MNKYTELIIVKNLTLAYQDNVILENINFTINYNDIFTIMGLSGCGKSTLLKSIIGLLRPITGHIYINGIDLWKLSDSDRNIMLRKFGITYQTGALFSSMTIAENIELPLKMYSGLSNNQISKIVKQKLDLVGLTDFGDFYPADISGGMAKRAALARAMALNPEILFFDEPSAGLDPIRSKNLDDLILHINKKFNTTVVLVTHELDTILNIANNSIYLDANSKGIIESGNPHKILKNTKNKQVVDFLTRINTYKKGA